MMSNHVQFRRLLHKRRKLRFEILAHGGHSVEVYERGPVSWLPILVRLFQQIERSSGGSDLLFALDLPGMWLRATAGRRFWLG